MAPDRLAGQINAQAVPADMEREFLATARRLGYVNCGVVNRSRAAKDALRYWVHAHRENPPAERPPVDRSGDRRDGADRRIPRRPRRADEQEVA